MRTMRVVFGLAILAGCAGGGACEIQNEDFVGLCFEDMDESECARADEPEPEAESVWHPDASCADVGFPAECVASDGELHWWAASSSTCEEVVSAPVR